MGASEAQATSQPLDPRVVELIDRTLGGSIVGIEILCFFAANPYVILSLEALAHRVVRDPTLLKPALDRLVETGYLRVEGRGGVYVLGRDKARLEVLEAVARAARTPEERVRLASGRGGEKEDRAP
jgi:DNA-binding IscR family transcriptional regulator